MSNRLKKSIYIGYEIDKMVMKLIKWLINFTYGNILLFID